MVDPRLLMSVLRQRNALSALMTHEARDRADLHVAAAAIVRSMLCDTDFPTLLKLAESAGVLLKVWASFQPDVLEQEAPTFFYEPMVWTTSGPMYGLRGASIELDLEIALRSPVAAISLTNDQRGSWVTPANLIKWVSNKEGPAHFDPKPKASLEQVKQGLVVYADTASVEIAIGGEIVELRSFDDFGLRTQLLEICAVTLELATGLLQTCGVPELSLI